MVTTINDFARGVGDNYRHGHFLRCGRKVSSAPASPSTNIHGLLRSKTRREYTVLGDSVNLSARLMQKVVGDGHGGVLCDAPTKILAESSGLIFEKVDSIRVKGKSDLIEIFQPYEPVIADGRGT